MTRSRSSSPAPDVFPIYFFVYLFIFFACHATVVVFVVVVVATGFVLKRLFASVATVCLAVGPSAVKHHRFFLEYSRVGFQRTQGLEPQPAGVLVFQNLAILFLFRTPNERDVRTFEETSTRTNMHDIN